MPSKRRRIDHTQPCIAPVVSQLCLLLQQHHLDLFAAHKKTVDIRSSMPPKDVLPNSEIYFCVDRGHYNVSGQKVLHAICRAEFLVACKTTHEDLKGGSIQHALDPCELEALVERKRLCMWTFRNVAPLSEPLLVQRKFLKNSWASCPVHDLERPVDFKEFVGTSSVASQTSPLRTSPDVASQISPPRTSPEPGQPCKEEKKSIKQDKETDTEEDVMPSAKAKDDIPAAPVPVAEGFRREDRSTVRSLADAFHWPKDAICELEDNEGIGVLKSLIDTMASTSITTAYSGIDAPGTALNLLTASLAQRFPDERVAPPRHLSDTEWSREAQLELLTMHEKDDSHLFGDIDTFFNANLQTCAKGLLKTPKIALEVLSPAIRSGQAVDTVAYCLRHGRRCQHPAAKIHVAGTTCTAFSPRGLQRGKDDPTIVHFLAWVGLRLKILEPIIIQENVKAFSEELIAMFLGHAYFMDVIVIDALDVGWPSKRERKWIVLRHKQKIISETSPLSSFVRRFWRACQTTWREYFFAHKYRNTNKSDNTAMGEDEFIKEIEWAQNRKASCAFGAAPLDPNDPKSFSACLNSTEISYLDEYMSKDPRGELVYQLNQNPLAGMGTTSTITYLHCIIHNVGLLYSATFQRWMMPSELLVAQGFPMHPEINEWAFNEHGPTALVHPACSFNTKRHDKNGVRKVRNIGGQVGNSMNVNVVGIVLLWCLISPKRLDTVSPAIRAISMLRRAW